MCKKARVKYCVTYTRWCIHVDLSLLANVQSHTVMNLGKGHNSEPILWHIVYVIAEDLSICPAYHYHVIGTYVHNYVL